MKNFTLAFTCHRRLQVCLGLTILFSFVGRGQIFAETISSTYAVTFSEDERFLNALHAYGNGTMNSNTLNQIESLAACDNPHNRIRARNRPAVLVENDGVSHADLTSFTMRINQAGFEFGSGDVGSPDYLGNHYLASHYLSPNVNILGSSVSTDGSLLTVNFSGLAPGESAIFRIDIDPKNNNGFPFPDYREALFGLGSLGEAGVNQLGETSATFSMGETSATTAPATLLAANTAIYINANIRAYHTNDPVGQLGGGGTTIPEPTTATLLAIALLGWSQQRRRAWK